MHRLMSCGRLVAIGSTRSTDPAPHVQDRCWQLLKDLGAGDVLVVVRLDRLARSVSHLLEVIEDLEKRGVHFRSLRDPIDTSTPQGMFSLAVLGAVAQLERALIAERTKSGMKAAKARGRLAGNPGLRECRPEAIRAVSSARDRVYLEELISTAQTWLPMVRKLRPQHNWDDVVRILNRRGHDWTVERLRRAVHRMVREKQAEPELLARSPRRPPGDHLMRLVAGIAIADPDLSLRDIAPNWIRCTSDRPAAAGNGSRPPSGTCWRKHAALDWCALKGLAHEAPNMPVARPTLHLGNFFPFAAGQNFFGQPTVLRIRPELELYGRNFRRRRRPFGRRRRRATEISGERLLHESGRLPEQLSCSDQAEQLRRRQQSGDAPGNRQI